MDKTREQILEALLLEAQQTLRSVLANDEEDDDGNGDSATCVDLAARIERALHPESLN